MPNSTRWQQHKHARNMAIQVIISLCLAVAASFVVFPMHTSARTVERTDGRNSLRPYNNGLTLQVNAGFHTRYREDNWVPVQVTVSNRGPDFSGTLAISLTNLRPIVPPASYQQPITLPHGAQKTLASYLPLYFASVGPIGPIGPAGSAEGVLVRVLDGSGNAVIAQTSPLNALGEQDVFVGILSDQATGFDTLRATTLPNQGGSVVVEPLDVNTFPGMTVVLRNFNVIVLDNFSTGTLGHDQLTALQTWVDQGGVLLEVGGPEWQKTLTALPPGLLPVSVKGIRTLPAKTSVLPFEGAGTLDASSAPTLKSPITISTAMVGVGNPAGTAEAETVLVSGTVPLIVQTRQGRGFICYLAFDPSLEPLVSWSGTGTLWRELLVRTLGDQLFLTRPDTRSVSDNAAMVWMLQALLPNTLVSPWALVFLALVYLLVLGPLRLYIVRRTKQRNWSWRIVLASIVVFSLFTYGLALNQRGRAILTSSVSLVQLSQESSLAHVTTYLSVFVPNQGNFLVHLSGNGAVQPLPSNFFQRDIEFPNQTTLVTPTQHGVDTNLQGVDIWTLRSLLVEQDRPVQGGLTSHLVLQNSQLTGTVTSTLAYNLSDVYVLLQGSFVQLGNLAAGQTAHIDLPLRVTKFPLDTSLTDQLAAGSKLPTPYILGNGQAQNEEQRHLAILTALSGEGYYTNLCSGRACGSVGSSLPSMPLESPGVLMGGPNAYRFHSFDPLLIPGEPATLIGWAEQGSDAASDITINGISPGGTHETLLQAPLDITFANTENQLTEPTLTPANFIAGQVVGVHADNVALWGSRTYELLNGSMTFEFALPSTTSIQQLSNMTVVEGLTQRRGRVGDPYMGQFAASLYNWTTGTWDEIPLSIYSFTTTDIADYVGPGGRVLLQCVNQDPSQGSLLFDRPALSVSNSS